MIFKVKARLPEVGVNLSIIRPLYQTSSKPPSDLFETSIGPLSDLHLL